MGMLLRRHSQMPDTSQLGRRAPPIMAPEEPTPKRATKAAKHPKAPTPDLTWPTMEQPEQELELSPDE